MIKEQANNQEKKWLFIPTVACLHPGPTLDGDLLSLEVAHVSEQDLLPVTTVADEAQVGQRPLWGPHLLLHLGQQVACGTEHHRHVTRLPTAW